MTVTLTLTSMPWRWFRRVTLPLLLLLAVVAVGLQLQSMLTFLVRPPTAISSLRLFRRQDLSGVRKGAAGMEEVAGVGEGEGRVRGVGRGEGGRWFNPPDCEVMRLLAGPDRTVQEAYSPGLVCGPAAGPKDVVCSTFMAQIDLHDDGDCTRLHDDTTVPRYVYYVIFGTYEFKFLHYVSFMAAKRFLHPTAMYLVGDAHPYGFWWQRMLKDVKGLRFVHRPRPPTIGNKSVRFAHHISDLVRLQVLLLNGGIYLDADMVMVRDVQPLLRHDLTLGLIENGTGMGNAFIAVKRNNDFIREWYRGYNAFNNAQFFNNSLWVARDMWHRGPRRVHMESSRLYRPNWFEADKLFKGWDYDWRQNYAVHVWTNGNPVPRSEEEVQTSNTTIAQVFRNALYGDPAPRFVSSPKAATASTIKTKAAKVGAEVAQTRSREPVAKVVRAKLPPKAEQRNHTAP